MTVRVWFDMPVKDNAWRVIWTFAWALLRRDTSVRISIDNATVKVTEASQ